MKLFTKAGELEAAKAATEKKSGSKDNNVALVAIPVRLCHCLRICVSACLCVSALLPCVCECMYAQPGFIAPDANDAGTVATVSVDACTIIILHHLHLTAIQTHARSFRQLVLMIVLSVPFYKRNLERMGEKAAGKR